MIPVVLIGCLLVGGEPAFADTPFTPTYWNLKKVYLSPAKHASGHISPCDGTKENDLATQLAPLVAQQLNQRHYKVLVGSGSPSQAVTRSNNWDADVHIPLHSNAGNVNCNSPFYPSNGGTLVMYASTAGQHQGAAGAKEPGHRG